MFSQLGSEESEQKHEVVGKEEKKLVNRGHDGKKGEKASNNN